MATVTSPSEVRRETRVIGESLSDHRNSLNFLRLVLASIVLLSHGAALGFFLGWAGVVNHSSAAQVALYAFFGISGYLIVQSVMRTSPAGYLWRRVLRIFPGLIVCLIVTAAVFGVIAWQMESHPVCGFSCYLRAPDSPFMYVVKNALLANPYWFQHTIAGTPYAIERTWNSPIWTLFYEFLCYMMLLVFGIVGLLRRRVLTLVVTVVLWMAILTITVVPSLSNQFSVFHFTNMESMLRFAEIFLTAAVLYLYRERIPDSGWLALACAAVYVGGLLLPLGGRIPTYSFTPSDITLPFLVYPVLWLGIHLPFRGIGSRNDYSYGIYIYGWPITQLCVLWHLNRWGVGVFVLLVYGLTVPFAVGSWWLVEKPAQRLRSRVSAS